MKPECTINRPMCILKGKIEVNFCDCNECYCDVVWGIGSYIFWYCLGNW
jgi:hypothetical protein